MTQTLSTGDDRAEPRQGHSWQLQSLLSSRGRDLPFNESVWKHVLASTPYSLSIDRPRRIGKRKHLVCDHTSQKLG